MVEIVPTGGALGAEVRGVDASTPLDQSVVARLKQGLVDELLLFFRDQRLEDADLVRFTRYFGDARAHVREQPDRPLKEIFVVSNVMEDGKPIGALGSGELAFHSDLSYLPLPGLFSVVYAVEVPRRGGDTQWVNCYAAYDALPSTLRERVLPLRAVHRHGEEKQNPATPAAHPVIRTHPQTNRRAIFVGHQFTRYVVGVSKGESRAILEQLLAHVSRPEFVWTHKWRVGDLVIWDNRCTLHRREAFDDRDRRVLKRTQIFGEAPYLAL
ncbi:MAG TPA: TauD/TfdA family dioxygenase [Vicinamibacteria bacterium]|nr:TauD/TfdA family dioxygenase [Vicinamibacteria bacterium]